jgi:hypothetical protein
VAYVAVGLVFINTVRQNHRKKDLFPFNNCPSTRTSAGDRLWRCERQRVTGTGQEEHLCIRRRSIAFPSTPISLFACAPLLFLESRGKTTLSRRDTSTDTKCPLSLRAGLLTTAQTWIRREMDQLAGIPRKTIAGEQSLRSISAVIQCVWGQVSS